MTITGTVVAEGNISFTGNNIIVTAVPPYPALIAQGNIVGGSGNNLTITGVVYSEGNFEFNDCNNFVFSGNLIVGGDIQLASANNFNITFVANDPPYFSGGGSGGDPSINSISNSWGEI